MLTQEVFKMRGKGLKERIDGGGGSGGQRKNC